VAERYKRNPNSTCLVCSKAIYRRPVELKRGRVFCSQFCRGLSDRKESPCVVCQKPIMAHLNKRTCSRACANIHRTGIRYKIGRPRDKVRTQHALKIRLLAERGGDCERCGYNRTEVLEVHHRDRDREHNDLQNLELICPNCHAEEHYLKNPNNWYRKSTELEK
jgi:predicted nucleic acid-binding Zn ribbon protein